MKANEIFLPEDTIPNTGKVPVLGLGTSASSPIVARMLDGEVVNNLINNKIYVRGDVIPLLLTVPGFFKFMPQPEELAKLWKNIIETHTTTIGGLDSTMSASVANTRIAKSIDAASYTGVSVAKSTPVHGYVEKEGRIINLIHEMYMMYGMESAYEPAPLVTKLDTYEETVWTPDMYGFSIMYIEPDITKQKVVNCWMGVDLFPITGGENVGAKDIAGEGATVTHSITYEGVVLPYTNTAVRNLAQKLLTDIFEIKNSFADHPIFLDDVAPEVKDAGNSGHKGTLQPNKE